MFKSVWRVRAKVVGVLEAARTVIGMVVLVGLSCGLIKPGFKGIGILLVVGTSTSAGMTLENVREFESNLWTLLVVGTILSGVDIWVVIKLLKACKEECEQAKALANARLWRNVTIVMSTLSFRGLVELDWYLIIVTVLWDIVALYTVQKFIADLEACQSRQANAEESYRDGEPLNVQVDKGAGPVPGRG